jgi:hypothetical protein
MDVILVSNLVNVLLCGGPWDGQMVPVLSGQSEALMSRMDPVNHRVETDMYYIVTDQNVGDQVGIHSSYIGQDAVKVVEVTRAKRKEILEQKTLTSEPRAFLAALSATEDLAARTGLSPVTAEATPKVPASATQAAHIRQLMIAHARRHGYSIVEILRAFELGREEQEETEEEGSTTLTLKTNDPDRYRLLDLTTSSLSRWDTEKKAFVKVVHGGS